MDVGVAEAAHQPLDPLLATEQVAHIASTVMQARSIAVIKLNQVWLPQPRQHSLDDLSHGAPPGALPVRVTGRVTQNCQFVTLYP